jgi:hypothetical protein
MEAGKATGRGSTPPPGDAWTVLSHLLTGFLLLGGIGWGLDQLLDTRLFLPIGLLAGGAASIGLIYIRFGKS